jgi:hypothetical protein
MGSRHLHLHSGTFTVHCSVGDSCGQMCIAYEYRMTKFTTIELVPSVSR